MTHNIKYWLAWWYHFGALVELESENIRSGNCLIPYEVRGFVHMGDHALDQSSGPGSNLGVVLCAVSSGATLRSIAQRGGA